MPKLEVPKLPLYRSCDCETTGTMLHHFHLPFAVSTCSNKGVTKWYEAPVNPKTRVPDWGSADLQKIRIDLESAPFIVLHNSKFDVRALSKIGIEIPWEKVHDTLLMSHVLDNSEDHGLKPLAAKYLKIPADDETQLKESVNKARAVARQRGWANGDETGWDYWLPKATGIDRKSCERYGRLDAFRTALLFSFYWQELHRQGLWEQYEVERKLLPILYQMEQTGVGVLVTSLSREIKRYEADTFLLEKKIVQKAASYDLPEFNVNSKPQLASLLHSKLNVPILAVNQPNKEFPEGVPKLDATTIDQHLARCETGTVNGYSPTAKVILANVSNYSSKATSLKYLKNYRSLKLANSLHGSLNQTGTATTRLSMSNPNLENVDPELRIVFGPRSGCFWFDPDYANIELRLLASVAGETDMLDVFKRGESVMMLIATRLWGLSEHELAKGSPHYPKYKRTKNFVYAFSYGAGEAKADATAGLPGATRRFKDQFKAIGRLMQETIRKAEKDGFIHTLQGYRLWIPRTLAYKALNYFIQGTAGGVLKRAIINLAEVLKSYPGCQQILPVHDEIVIECPNRYRKSKELARGIKEAMEQPGKEIGIETPVSMAIVTKSWDQPQEIKV